MKKVAKLVCKSCHRDDRAWGQRYISKFTKRTSWFDCNVCGEVTVGRGYYYVQEVSDTDIAFLLGR